MIRRRGVFHLAGYDPIGSAWYRLFKRELAIFARTWNVTAELSELASATEGSNPHWTITTRADNWRTDTTYELLLWDDIVLADLARPMTSRLAKSPAVFFDFVSSGAIFRYFRANWKYGAFFLYPYLYVCAFALIGLLGGGALANFFALSGLAWAGATVVIAVAVFFLLLRWPGRRWRVHQALDDWIFSRDYVHDRRPDLNARLDRFAESVVARARSEGLDEIVIVGHSMGATLALEVVVRALGRDREFARRGTTVALLTVGSTIPKFTLHPAAGRLRRAARDIVDAHEIAWAEYHARDDAISFYRFDPVSEKRIQGEQLNGKPIIRRSHFHDMLEIRTFWRNRWKFMRLHYQFVMANERRAVYDYFMMVCGPIPFLRAVLTPSGPAGFFAMDGALIDADASATSPAPDRHADALSGAGLHGGRAR